jgi:hypothetical protein
MKHNLVTIDILLLLLQLLSTIYELHFQLMYGLFTKKTMFQQKRISNFIKHRAFIQMIFLILHARNEKIAINELIT